MFAIEEEYPKRITVRVSQFFLEMCPPALYCCVRPCLAILYTCLPALGCCGRLCLAILCLPALDVASSSFDFEKHKLFGVYGGVISFQGKHSSSSVLVHGTSKGQSRLAYHDPHSLALLDIACESLPLQCNVANVQFDSDRWPLVLAAPCFSHSKSTCCNSCVRVHLLIDSSTNFAHPFVKQVHLPNFIDMY